MNAHLLRLHRSLRVDFEERCAFINLLSEPRHYRANRALIGTVNPPLVETLSAMELSSISAGDVVRLAERFPQLMRELWRRVATEDATAQQWLVNVGRRSALERTAHLLCEIYARCEKTR